MAISFAPLTRANAPAALALLSRSWHQDWGADLLERFFEWRYFARPSGETRLALDGDSCVAIIDSFLRPYLKDGRPIVVRETCDWFCLPEYRPLGIGIKLMRQFMSLPEPMLSIGGTPATLALLPRLKWQRLPDVDNYVLPISARAVLDKLLRRLGRGSGAAAWLPSGLKIRRPRSVPPPSAADVNTRIVMPLAAPRDPAFGAFSLAALVDESDAAWLSSALRPFGDVVGLQFSAGAATAGTTLSSIEPCRLGYEAKILDVCGSTSDGAVLDWIVSETACQLVARGADIVRCRASSPRLADALARAGFLRRRPHATYWWPGDTAFGSQPLHLGWNRADDAWAPKDQVFATSLPTSMTRNASDARPRIPAPDGVARGNG